MKSTPLPEEVEKEFNEKYVLEWLGHVDIDKDKKNHAPKEMMDFLRSLLLQSYEQGKKEERERIKNIDLNPEGRHLRIGELHGDLIDALQEEKI